MTAADSRRHANAAPMIFCCSVSLELSIPLLEVIHAPDELQARQPRTSSTCGYCGAWGINRAGTSLTRGARVTNDPIHID